MPNPVILSGTLSLSVRTSNQRRPSLRARALVLIRGARGEEEKGEAEMEVLRSETMGDSGRHGDGIREDMGSLLVGEGAASRNLSQKMQLRRSISLLETEEKGMDGMEARTHARGGRGTGTQRQ